MTARRRLAAALLVPSGVVVSHLIAYSVARPEGSVRADGITAAHGHLAPLAMVAMLGVAGALTVAGYAGATGRLLRLSPRLLAGTQAVAFAGMELGEHLSHGSSLDSALREPSLWIGLAVQVAIAWLACLLLRLGELAGQRLACRRAPRWARRVAVARPARGVTLVVALSLGSISRRGPPRLPLIG